MSKPVDDKRLEKELRSRLEDFTIDFISDGEDEYNLSLGSTVFFDELIAEILSCHSQGVGEADEKLRDQFIEFFRTQTFEMWRGLFEVAELNENMTLTEDELNNAEAEQINEFGEAMWQWFVAHRGANHE